MDDPTYTDGDLDDFFQSPDTRRAGLAARVPEPARADADDLGSFFQSPDAPRPPAPASPGPRPARPDDALASFFDSPDGPPRAQRAPS
ncbi:MAG TPA: hypothetical protein VF576_08225, partial [Rubricoccaceae bacterium]